MTPLGTNGHALTWNETLVNRVFWGTSAYQIERVGRVISSLTRWGASTNGILTAVDMAVRQSRTDQTYGETPESVLITLTSADQIFQEPDFGVDEMKVFRLGSFKGVEEFLDSYETDILMAFPHLRQENRNLRSLWPRSEEGTRTIQDRLQGVAQNYQFSGLPAVFADY
jgi:hypothetical protein